MRNSPATYLIGAGIAAAVMAAILWHGAQPASASVTSDAPTETGLTVYWSDGDSGRLSDGTMFRLHGIDAPETGSTRQQGGAKCEAERRLGFDAKAAAVELTRGRTVVVSERRKSDRHGRTVVRLSLDGEDVATRLVAGGTHAAWNYDARQKKPDWCAIAREAGIVTSSASGLARGP